MSLRLVLYAEGPGEDRGEEVWLPDTGKDLPASLLGAAHHLMARVVAAVRPIPVEAIRFVGQVTLHGASARGSQLRSRKTLERLLTFAHSTRRPHLAIVLVDEDGDGDRRSNLLGWTKDLTLPPCVVAVPIREFEAWLIADQQALAQVAQVTETPRAPEGMVAREAKTCLQGWIDKAVPGSATQAERAQRTHQIRSDLARQVRLDVLDRLSAFKLFRSDLSVALAAIP